VKSLSDLLDGIDSAWPLLQEWVAAANNAVELLPPSANAAEVLVEMQVTTHSLLGAMAFHTGGALVDSGWLRLLGSGHPRLPRSLPSWNTGRTLGLAGGPAGFYLVADDMVGGVFAINGGALGRGPRQRLLPLARRSGVGTS
jgi:hypothetical protein